MAKAFFIAHVSVNHPEDYAQYAGAVPATINAYGGKYLVRSANAEQIEGAPNNLRHVVLEFESRAQAMLWYNSPEYQSILPIRLASAQTSMILVDEYTESSPHTAH